MACCLLMKMRTFLTWLLLIAVSSLLAESGIPPGNHKLVRVIRDTIPGIECMKGDKFYRNPTPNDDGLLDCWRYYLCIDEKVHEFRCAYGLFFDITRQICDFKLKVHNCDIAAETPTPRPLFSTYEPICPEGQLACADKKCLDRELFCDGQVDCSDASDEGWCDAQNDPNAALRCDTKNCTLPECYCSVDGTLIPGGLTKEQTPQMVVVTFDDGINDQNWELYQQIFQNNRTNPNGCPIRATFYLSHEYTNYRHVQKLWNVGHEIAIHSITHRQPELWWTFNATLEDWFDEFMGQANIVNRFAGIPLEELRGVRVPFLRVGWNTQFLMMKEFGFLYDSTIVAPKTDPPLWPYTMDYRVPHRCVGARQKCPSRSFPGIWEMVLNPLDAEGYICAMMDQCPTHLTEPEVLEMMMHNFNRHYSSNRAPFGLYFHTVWFKEKQNVAAFKRFIDELLKKKDVWFVTNYQAIEWMRDPTTLSNINSFEPWDCKKAEIREPQACNLPKVCKLMARQLKGERYFYSCFDCPERYPWVRNEFGLDL